MKIYTRIILAHHTMCSEAPRIEAVPVLDPFRWVSAGPLCEACSVRILIIAHYCMSHEDNCNHESNSKVY